jgi:hypothetical protein
MYSEYNSVPLKDGALKKIALFRDDLVTEIINYIFRVKGKDLTLLSFDDLNNKFDSELYVLNS